MVDLFQKRTKFVGRSNQIRVCVHAFRIINVCPKVTLKCFKAILSTSLFEQFG